MKLLTVKEAAEILKCSQEHIRRLIRSGRLKGFSEGRRSGFRILEKDLEDYVLRRIDENKAEREGITPLFDFFSKKEGNKNG